MDRPTLAEIEVAVMTPMAYPSAEMICEMRYTLVEEAKLCGFAEAQNLSLVDLFLFYAEWKRQEPK
jgi:hypothetical protein